MRTQHAPSISRQPHLLFIGLLMASSLALTSCAHDEVVAPSNTAGTVDDHGGNGTDDPGGDDNGGG